ncbi:SIR2 family protein [Hyphobacterium marinum]|uniref:SIR2 family protein n=1 Tax=Hyphobacterium marinum TaxID=3116574 RepID=A0ABU7LYY5_9PROT|nr:SIR2 family protein [Hyphobacterium sp. Y6023]MEE2566754.1 SIR2 family protein [Hyphobacterium sp. Y6023]
MTEIEGDISRTAPSADRIRQSSRRNFYRALNIRRVVVFSGAGLSMAYGHVTWNQLVRLAKKHILSELLKLRREEHGQPDECDNNVKASGDPVIRSLNKTLSALNPKRNTLGEAEANMLALDLCERLEQEITRYYGPPKFPLREYLAREIGDNDRYVREQFENRIRHLGSLRKDDNEPTLSPLLCETEINAICPSHDKPGHSEIEPGKEAFRNFYSRDRFDELIKQFPDTGEPGSDAEQWLFDRIKQEFEKDAARAKRIDGSQASDGPGGGAPLSPEANHALLVPHPHATSGPPGKAPNVLRSDRRSFFAVLFGAIRARHQAITSLVEKHALAESTWKAIANDTGTAAPNPQQGTPAAGSVFEGVEDRSERLYFARPIVDPVAKLFTGLEIRRFLTTNYDFEIERYLEHGDYLIGAFTDALSKGPQRAHRVVEGEQRSSGNGPDLSALTLRRRSRSGHESRSSVLQPGTAAELIEFAAGNSELYADIFHLHGRADAPQHMVLGDTDYNATYMNTDASRRVLDEALNVVFEGNSVLFVGSGLSEADLLRPLRQFVTKRGRDTARPVFALMPAMKNKQDRDIELVNLFNRYSVQTIYFGARPHEEDSLAGHSSGDLQKNFHPLFRPFDEGETPEPSDVAELGEEVEVLAALEDALKGEDEKVESRRPWPTNNRLRAFFEKFPKSGAGIPDFPVMRANGFQLKAALPDIDVNTTLASVASEYHAWLRQCLPRTARIRIDRDAFIFLLHKFRQAILGKPGCSSQAHLHREATIEYQDFVEKLREKVITIALDHELEYLRACWHYWWETWQETPLARQAEFNEVNNSPEGTETDRKLKSYVRHGLFTRVKWDKNVQRTVSLSDGITFPAGLAWNARRDALKEALQVFGDDRRTLLVQLPEGGGKGLFFHQLQIFNDWRHFSRFTYTEAYFVNTAFSADFSAIFEGIVGFLENPTDPEAGLSTDTTQSGTRSRIERLIGALERRTGAQAGRQVIVVNNFDIFFNERGNALTKEVEAFFKALLGRTDAPVDVILIARKLPDRKLLREIEKLAALENGSDDKASSTARRVGLLDFMPVEFGNCEAALGLAVSFEELLRAKQAAFHRPESETGGSGGKQETERPNEIQSLLDAIAFIYENTGSCLYIQAMLFAALKKSQTGYASAKTWISMLRQLAASSPPMKACDEIIGKVIECYTSEAQRPETTTERAHNALENMILRHLAYIDAPVEAAVLTVCPGIVDVFKSYEAAFLQSLAAIPNKNKEIDPTLQNIRSCKGRETIVSHVLSLMVSRVLVIPVQPRNKADEEFRSESVCKPRYALHRKMRSYLLRQFGGSSRGRGEVNLYDLSVYSAQPRDKLPLDADQFRFVTSLARALARPDTWRGADESFRKETTNMALRAALGLVRSSLSVSNLSRVSALNETMSGDHATVFDAHLTRLRDLAMTAQRWPKEDAAKISLQAYYQDEIVWLYNERGVTALAQGRLFDAYALLNKAQVQNRKIEGKPGTFNAARISLNLAVADVRRGNFKAARTKLRWIRNQECSETRREPDSWTEQEHVSHVAAAAQGYLGRILHQRGRFERARKHYEAALKVLNHNERLRGVALFERYLGDLERATGRMKRARRALENSIAAAQSGQYLDLLHYSRIAEARTFAADKGLMGEALARVQTAHDYAIRMGLYGLQVYAATARGTIHLSQGENKLAGECAQEALAVSLDHGLRLSRISAMQLQGMVYLSRGLLEQGRYLLQVSTRMAERHEFQVAVERGQRLLLSRPFGAGSTMNDPAGDDRLFKFGL